MSRGSPLNAHDSELRRGERREGSAVVALSGGSIRYSESNAAVGNWRAERERKTQEMLTNNQLKRPVSVFLIQFVRNERERERELSE